MSTENPSGPIITAVAVRTEANRRSHFDCPHCGRRISFTNSYPLSFHWKVCPGCRWQWVPVLFEIGPHADDIVGQTNVLRITASGNPV